MTDQKADRIEALRARLDEACPYFNGYMDIGCRQLSPVKELAWCPWAGHVAAEEMAKEMRRLEDAVAMCDICISGLSQRVERAEAEVQRLHDLLAEQDRITTGDAAP